MHAVWSKVQCPEAKTCHFFWQVRAISGQLLASLAAIAGRLNFASANPAAFERMQTFLAALPDEALRCASLIQTEGIATSVPARSAASASATSASATAASVTSACAASAVQEGVGTTSGGGQTDNEERRSAVQMIETVSVVTALCYFCHSVVTFNCIGLLLLVQCEELRQ